LSLSSKQEWNSLLFQRHYKVKNCMGNKKVRYCETSTQLTLGLKKCDYVVAMTLWEFLIASYCCEFRHHACCLWACSKRSLLRFYLESDRSGFRWYLKLYVWRGMPKFKVVAFNSTWDSKSCAVLVMQGWFTLSGTAKNYAFLPLKKSHIYHRTMHLRFKRVLPVFTCVFLCSNPIGQSG